MLQAVIKNGKILAEEVPAPMISVGKVLIKVINSCISSGTELIALKSSSKTLFDKAMEKPEKVMQLIDNLKTVGPAEVINQVKKKVDGEKLKKSFSLPIGYSVAGVVQGVGQGITKFKVGDYVAAAGAGYASHAEFVNVPENLVVKMPDNLNFTEASTVALGGIAMQGVRRADLKLGEFCVVIGAGILGLLSLQMLRLSGIRVLVIDIDDRRLSIAKEYGAEKVFNPANYDVVKEVESVTGGHGADAVIFTAATNDKEPLSQAFQMTKKKGKVVLVGVAGKEIDRNDMYKKELDYIMSTSYGPGRYDVNYEEKGVDYPYAYVRWTENRNMEEYLRLLSTGEINLTKMIESKFPISEVTRAFEQIQSSKEKPIITLLEYSGKDYKKLENTHRIILKKNEKSSGKIKFALIGAGNFATGMHLKNLSKMDDKYELHAVVDNNGLKAKDVIKKYDGVKACTDISEILTDDQVDLVIICTRHNSHADLVLKCLEAGKHVFVEKPLATNIDELNRIKNFYYSSEHENKKLPVLMVGFNRRFSPVMTEIKKITDKRCNPLFIHYRMNAGFIDKDVWVHEDGGRIIGEACHIIDLMTFFTGSRIKTVSSVSLTPVNEKFMSNDNRKILLKYEDGSVCSIDYFAVGNKHFPKEYMELSFDEKTIIVDNFISLNSFGIKLRKKFEKGDKGHFNEFVQLYEVLKSDNKEFPIELWDIFQTTEITFRINEHE